MTAQPAPAFDVEALRAEFPALRREQDGRPVAFLDGPGGTQVPQRVIDAVTDYYTHTNANAGGAFVTSEASDAIIERGPRRGRRPPRGRRSPDEIKFGYNMSTLTLHIGRSIGATLGPGDEIVVTTLDHEANVSTWEAMAAGPRPDRPQGRRQRRRRDPRPRGPRIEAQSSTRSSSRSGYASNAVGTINPVAEIVARAHEVGALTYVDAVAYAPHGPDRCPRARHRLPRLQRLQVVRAAPRRAVRQGRGPRPTAGVQGPPRRTTGSRPARRRSNRSPGRSPRPTTCAMSAARTATSPGQRAPRTPASGGANSSRA